MSTQDGNKLQARPPGARTLTVTKIVPPRRPGGKQRVLRFVPIGRTKVRALGLAEQVQPLVPSWCMDYCWVPGRDHRVAVKLADLHTTVRPFWLTLDIVSFFANVRQPRMWAMLRRYGDGRLAAEVQRFCEDIGCRTGLPEGCSFSPACANLYLADLDRRWRGNGVRVADNVAVADPGRYCAELADIGLRARYTDNLLTTLDGSWPPPEGVLSTAEQPRPQEGSRVFSSQGEAMRCG